MSAAAYINKPTCVALTTPTQHVVNRAIKVWLVACVRSDVGRMGAAGTPGGTCHA